MARLLPLLLITAGTASAEDWRKLIASGQLKLATPALEKACATEPAPGDSCYYLARNYYALAEYEAARKAFDRLLAAEPTGRVYRGASLNYAALGRDQDAERHFRKAVELGADEARVDLGAFVFRQGRIAEAARILEAAVQATPESARANLESGRVLLQLGQLEAAAKRLEKATQRSPSDWNAHLLLGRAYQRMGRDADAERELELGEAGWRRKQP
jgi:tetratricopeptide (TPR) repeat protein